MSNSLETFAECGKQLPKHSLHRSSSWMEQLTSNENPVNREIQINFNLVDSKMSKVSGYLDSCKKNVLILQ